MAADLFDEVIVAAMRNPQKGEPLFDMDEREAMLKEAFAHLPNVRTTMFGELVVTLALRENADFIVKGLRAVSDFENELQMAQTNRKVAGVPTVFLPSTSASSFIASKYIREDRPLRCGCHVDGAARRGAAPGGPLAGPVSSYDDPLAPGLGASEVPLAGDPFGGSGSLNTLAGATPEVVEDVDAALADLERYIQAARASSLSSQVRLDRDHVLELIRIVRARLPVALRSARWLIKERSDYLERARRDAEELVDQVKGGGGPHGSPHRGRQAGRGAGAPDRGGGRGAGPPASARDGGLLRRASGPLRGMPSSVPSATCGTGGASCRERPTPPPGEQPALLEDDEGLFFDQDQG